MNTLDSLFEWVLAATLRASALAVVILGIQFVLRRRLPAPWRHALWLPMLLVLILPMLPKMPFGILPVREAAAPMAIEAAASSALPVAEKAAPAPVVKRASLTVTGYIAIVWLAGACLILGAGVAGYRRNLKRIKSGARSPDQKLRETLREATREAGLGAAPRVLMSPAVESPAVTGLIRPLLLLPASFPRGFNDAEARLILLHELTHVKRRDLPVNWLICVLQSMHWFNPLLWFAFARIREDREAACDAQVLSLSKTDRRSDYGHALLKLQSSAPATGLSLGFVGIFERGANLRSRIREISTHRQSHPAWRAVGVAMIGVLTLVGATQAQERQPRREAKGAQNSKVKDPRQVALEKKLDAIVIPVINFEDATLEDAVDFLRLRSRELDKTTEDPAEKGVNFVIKTTAPQAKTVTLALSDVSLRKAIENVAEAAELTMVVGPFAVTLMPREDAEQLEKREKLLQSNAMKAASGIIIPIVDMENTTLQEAVDFLNLRAAEIAKDGEAPKIELGKLENQEAKIGELRLRNLPLSEVLMYVAEATKAPLLADDEVIRFGK